MENTEQPIIPFKHKNLNVNLNLKALCNLRCNYCSIPEVSKSTNVPDMLLLKNIDILLNKMVDESYTWDFVMLIGAEPLMVRPEIVGEILNRINKVYPNCRQKIQTNGTLFTDEYAGKLEKYLNHPEILMMGWSFDGVKNIQDQWRDNSYDLAVDNLFNANEKYVFQNQLIMSVGPQHFEPENKSELLNFTIKCIDSGIHPTFSVVDYKLNEKSTLDVNVADIELWKPLADFLIEYDIINLCEKYFGPGYCRRDGNECSRVLFDLSDGGVYQCEKTFDIKNATINNYINSSIEECMLSRRACTQNCYIAPECKDCEYWDWCQGSCSLKRNDGVAYACELTKYILGYIKYTLKQDYFLFLKERHHMGKWITWSNANKIKNSNK